MSTLSESLFNSVHLNIIFVFVVLQFGWQLCFHLLQYVW